MELNSTNPPLLSNPSKLGLSLAKPWITDALRVEDNSSMETELASKLTVVPSFNSSETIDPIVRF